MASSLTMTPHTGEVFNARPVNGPRATLAAVGKRALEMAVVIVVTWLTSQIVFTRRIDTRLRGVEASQESVRRFFCQGLLNERAAAIADMCVGIAPNPILRAALRDTTR